MTTAIAEYSPTEAALADLASRYKGVVFDVTTRDGMQIAVKGRAELRGYRVALEKKRVELKAPALERTRLIDAEAKRITAELEALEAPIDEAIKAEEGRREREKREKEEAERARVASIQESIAAIGNRPGLATGKSAADIDVELTRVRDLPVTETLYGEFLPLAQAAKDKSIMTLQLMVDGARAQERERAEAQSRAAAEREELARLRQEQEERTRKEAAERAEREAADKQRRDALAAEEAASKARIAEQERAAKEARDKADAEARATREAEEAKRAKADEELRAHEAAVRAREEAVEAAAMELMDGEAMLARFVERFGKRAEFAGVVKAIKTYQAKPAAKATQAQEAQLRA